MNRSFDKGVIPEKWIDIYFCILNPFIQLLKKLEIHPNTFTTIGCIMGFAAAFFMGKGSFRMAGIFILFSGMLDNIDGQLARASNKVTKFGALYDSTLDRYGEVIFFLGMAYYFIQNGWYLTSVAIAIGLGGSLMVSYVRARAEGLGFECKTGILQRPERILLLGIGCIIHRTLLIVVIWIIAILSNVTAIQRIIYIWRKENRKG